MKKIYLIVSIAIVLLTISKVKSQNLTNYNLYAVNPVLYNPAYAIDDSKTRVFVNTHLQWVGFDGAPRANTFGIYSSAVKNMGFGLSVFNNKQGITNFTNLNLTYAYRANFGESHFLTFGVSAGFMMDRLTTGDITNADMSDVTIVNNSFKQNAFSARGGLIYFNKGFEASLAMPQLVNAGKSSGYVVSMFSYNFKLDDSWNLKPIIMYRDVKTSPVQFDGSVMASWKKTIWAQFGYRSNDSYLMCFGVNWKDFELGYAYQMEAGDIASVGTTHEIQLTYRFGKGPNEVKYEKVKSTLPSTAKAIHDTIYVMPLTENTKVVGTIVRKSDNKPIPGTITISENNKEVQKIAANNGVFNFDLKSGKTYKFEVSDNSYPTVSQTIEIPRKTLVKEVNLVVDFAPTVKVTVTDPESKAPVNAKIIISSNGKIYQTINANDNSSIKLQPGVYIFDCSADGYYSKKVTIDLTSQDFAEPNIQLDKVKKEAFSLGMINFETNKSIIKSESLPVLDNFIKVLKDNPTMRFEISGHTDNVGKADANKILSQNRAQACVDYMISKGIVASRLVPKGYGQTKPLVPNDTSENRFKNRRVEAKIIE